ncbi:hypothetical protein GOP47_0005766 [Adiantum capillus-veneris]|uniref:Potassium channel domain-containing protein n=1 Tax=Adiantum capillus-veneris TaxID=13818 RepID=A0A9D4V5M5_ADICA|nr:hypothetical protein GOP47_0005240 [Adiantum capillus-veneris]KAI5080287.1 hypothetical protein GOP47_0005766 [Adiantum capillus-veneris]
MEEPLLGSYKRPSILVNHGLFQIPEEREPEASRIIPISPSSIKEKLIFGSPDASPKSMFVWPDKSRDGSETEEPLLGTYKRPNILVNHGLFQIPEEREPEEARLIPISPSNIKEKLIFGSPDASPKSMFVWPDKSSSSEHNCSEDEDEGEQPLVPEDICTCGKSLNDSVKESQANAFDDSFIDSLIIGPRRAEAKLWNDLTKLDLDVMAPSPRYRSLSSSPLAAWFLSERDAAKRKSERGSEDGSYTIAMPPGSPTYKTTMDCNTCTKRLLHRARTAPALTGRIAGKDNKPRSTRGLSALPTLSVVSQAFIGLLLYLAVGVLIYSWKEDEFSGSTTHYIIDALYFCIVTMCTIGYGDITPTTPAAKLFSCAFVLVGFGFIDILLSGMVSYVLDKQETLLLSAVAAGHHETAENYLVDIKKGRMRIRSKVTLAFGVVVMCIGVGTLVMHYLESLGWLDAFYLSCMSVTTVGYGDHAFTTMAGRVFASVWLLVSTLAVARSFLYLAEARIDKRHRLIAKLVLEKEMTIADLLAADLDNDGCVSKSDFVVYKLKLMGKILEKDISEVCRQFSRLDTDNSGKISLSCLINLHEASTVSK